jgi:hypothetical protein
VRAAAWLTRFRLTTEITEHTENGWNVLPDALTEAVPFSASSAISVV